MRLQDYPRPQHDNGRGVHWIPYTWGQATDAHKRLADELVEHARAMNIRWALILNSAGEEWRANEYLVRRLVGPDPTRPEIMPIIRLGERFDPETLAKKARGERVGLDPDRVREIVRFYRALGAPYFQLYNEPNHIDEWPERIVPVEAVEICVEVWRKAALATLDAGGLPGLPPLAPGGSWPGGDDLHMLAAMLDRLDARLTVTERSQLYDKMWVGIHNYFLGRDIESLPADSHCFQKFVWYEGIIAEKIGHPLPILGGEGGLRMGLPPYGDNASEAQVAESTKEACRYMARAPEYYFCSCFWLLGSAIGGGGEEWESAAWFRKDGSRQEVVAALKRLGEFRREPHPLEVRFFYRNGYKISDCHLVKGAFLETFQALGGLAYCGYPTSDELREGEAIIQGFEKLTLERAPDGQVRIRGPAPHTIAFTIPSAAERLMAQGLSAHEVERALAEVATTYGPPETLLAGEYQVQLPTRAAWRNQDVINAFWIASGRTGFALMERAGLALSDLVRDRQAKYEGPAIERLNGLTPDERARVLDALPPLARRLVSFRIPSAYALLEAQGLNSETLAAALKQIVQEYGPVELLTPGRYAVTLPAEPLPPLRGSYTNQEIINAFWIAGARSWRLLNKARLDLAMLAADRSGPYTGPTIEELPGLTDQERAWIRAALPAKIALSALSRAVAAMGAPLRIAWEPAGVGSYTRGRQGYAVEMIVLHATHQSLRATLEATRALPVGFSPHYVIAQDGAIWQLVREEDAARHCALQVSDPHRDIVIRPNYRSLGVALVNWGLTVGDGGKIVWDPYTDEQYEALARLLRHLCRTHGIRRTYPPSGAEHFAPEAELASFNGILGYAALDRAAQGLGPLFDWARLQAALREGTD